jgi:3,8-divinyl protochlorophyllide a 8-vinyl-reductase (ferredoxin)
MSSNASNPASVWASPVYPLPVISNPAPTPETLCSSCGLCQIRAWPAKESFQSCVFELGWLGEQEKAVFGRERDTENLDEVRFGITRKRFVAKLKQPIADAQWSGIITRLSLKALDSKLVDAVVTLHRSKADFFIPEPVLAQTKDDILAARGSKPVISPVLKSLETAYQKGVKKLLVIGASCHIHVMRDFQRRFPYLQDVEIFALGIPCVDNIKPKRLRWILEKLSRSHKTVVYYEFMQDFTVHLRHESGELEKVPYFSLPQELSRIDLFAPSCTSCFDYLNSLADMTVGYVAAPLVGEEKRQWVMVRTEKGETLLDLIKDELDVFPETASGNAMSGLKKIIPHLLDMVERKPDETKRGRKIPIWLGKIIAAFVYRSGPRGTEFAKHSVDYHLIRNYFFVKKNYPEKLKTLVPKHVYKLLSEYKLDA